MSYSPTVYCASIFTPRLSVRALEGPASFSSALAIDFMSSPSS